MRSTARTRTWRAPAPIVEIASLYRAAQRDSRRRTLDGWLAAATATLMAAFIAAFAWYVVTPAMKSLIGP